MTLWAESQQINDISLPVERNSSKQTRYLGWQWRITDEAEQPYILAIWVAVNEDKLKDIFIKPFRKWMIEFNDIKDRATMVTLITFFSQFEDIAITVKTT